MKRAKAGVIRYPGGTVTMNWDWDDLNGYSYDYQVKEFIGKLTPADTWDLHYVPRPGTLKKETFASSKTEIELAVMLFTRIVVAGR